MNIPKEKLSLIGISIKVNRKARLKKTKSGKWNQANFADGICSQNTLIKIEHGHISRFPAIYEEAANKLGLKLGYFPEIDAQIDKITPKLYKAVEFYNDKQIFYYSKVLLKVLEPVKEYLWYCDLFNIIYKFNIYTQSDEYIEYSRIEYFTDCIEEFDFFTNEILKHLIFTSIFLNFNNKLVSIQDFKKIFHQLDIESSEFLCNTINTMIYYFVLDKTTSLLKHLELLERICNEKENLVRLLDGYNIVIGYLSVMGRNDVHPYISKFESLLNSLSLNPKKYIEYCYGLGIALFEIEEYEKALKYLELCSKHDDNKVYNIFVYMAGAQKKLNMNVQIPFYTKEEYNQLSTDLKVLYKYYKMNDDIPPFIRQKFIMEEVLPNLMINDDLIINIIREELLDLIQQTSHYKDAIIFDIKCRELLKA